MLYERTLWWTYFRQSCLSWRYTSDFNLPVIILGLAAGDMTEARLLHGEFAAISGHPETLL